MLAQLAVLWAFLQRDIYVYAKRIRFYIVNYLLLYPINYIITFGYFAPKALMHTADQAHVLMITLLSGNLLLIALNIIGNLSYTLIYDMAGPRSIDYQITHLKPKILLLKNIIFNALFSFIFLSPFFFICKFCLGSNFDIPQVSWTWVLMLTLLTCFCIAAYVQCAMCMMHGPRQIGSFWIRVNIPLFVLGGFWVPWFTIYNVSHLLGYIVLANPFIYVTEGLRSALTNSPLYISAHTSAGALVLFSIFFYFVSCYFFNKRLDPVN